MLIGTTNIADSLTFIRREMTGNDAVTGTLGLNSLMGRVAVIDYPRKRFCLFNEGNLPAPFWDATFANAIFRDRKFFLPVRVGNFASDAMFFDTGASEVPLHVNRTIWSQLTGKTSVADAETEIEGQAWGVPIRLFGARSKTSSTIGGVKIGSPVIYTTQTSKAIASDHQRIDGVIGNAPFWNGIVVLDLTVRMRFAYITP